MQKNRDWNAFAIIAGALLICGSIYAVVDLFIGDYYLEQMIDHVVRAVSGILLAVLCFRKSKGIIMFVAAGARALYKIYLFSVILIVYSQYFTINYMLYYVLLIVVYLMLIVLCWFNCIKRFNRQAAVVNKLWFASPALYTIATAQSILEELGHFSAISWKHYLSDFIEIIGLFFFCLWFYASCESGYSSEKREKAENIISPRNTGAELSDADKIRKIKELLEMGAITQEEFEEKKKQILNIR